MNLAISSMGKTYGRMFETFPRYEPTTHKIQTRFSTQNRSFDLSMRTATIARLKAENVYRILERVRDGDIILDELQIAS